jgi:hypothetical protein
MGTVMARHYNTPQSAHDIIRRIATNRPVALRIQEELVDENKDIVDTSAEIAVNRELIAQMTRHRTDLQVVRERMARPLSRMDEDMRRELEKQTKELQAMVEKTKKDTEEMASKYAAEKKRMETRLKEIEQEAERQAAKVLKFPVVLVHGFCDIPSLTGSWKVVENFLKGIGVDFYTPQMPPYGSIEERSEILIRLIAKKYPGRTVHLFGHSMVQLFEQFSDYAYAPDRGP